MKPIVFDPKKRPVLTYFPLGNSEKVELVLFEATSETLTVKAQEAPPFRGEISYAGKNYQVTIRDTQSRSNFYTLHLHENDGQELYVSLLKELDAQELTSWLLELPALRDNQRADQGNREYIDLHDSDELPLSKGIIAAVFEKTFVTLYRRPWLSALLLLLLSIFPALQLRDLKVDPSLDRILVKDSPLMKQYKKSLELFGSDKSAILYFKDDAIFTTEKLKKLRKLAWALEKEEKIERVRSVFTTTFIRHEGQEDTLFTDPLFQSLDETKREREEKLRRVQKDPNLHGRLIDVPQRTIIFVLELNRKMKGMVPIAKLLNEKISAYKGDFSEVFQTGEPTIELFQQEEMISSPKIFMPLIILVLLLCFIYFLGSAFAFVIILFATLLSTTWAFGWMTFLGIPIHMMTYLIPAILLTLSATEVVHIASTLKVAHEHHFNDEDSLRYLARDIGKALFLTLSTTALGFLSIRFSQIQVLQEFSIVASMGLIFAFLITIIYVPLHLRLFPGVKKDKDQKHSTRFFLIFEKYFIHFTYHFLFSKKALWFILFFILVNIFFATKVVVDNDTFRMIADRAQVKKDLNTFKERVGGMKSIHAVISFDKGASEEKITDSKNLQLLWELHQGISHLPEVKHVESFAGLMAILNREMRGGREDFYKVPKSQNLIAQYFIMLSRDDVDPFLTSDKRKANIKIAHDISSSRSTDIFIKELETLLNNKIKGSSFQFYLTSRNILNVHAAQTIISSQSFSLLTMAIVIIVLIALFFKSLSIGFLSLVPNLFPIFSFFGIMGLLNIPLNVGTSIVAAITIGIAADDTIHLFTRYFRDKETSLNPLKASSLTIADEVIPIITTSLSLALSFSFFSLTRFVPLMQFGLLSAYVLLLAVISDLYLGPILLSRYFLFKEDSKSFLKWMLIDQEAMDKGQVFHNLSLQEVSEVLALSKVKFIKKKNENLYIPLKSSRVAAFLCLGKKDISNLSPRTFEKICHNLKELSLY